jgi:hypothetical protein
MPRHTFVRWFIAPLILIRGASALAAQSTDIPLVELPYNTAHGPRAPGMQQSLAITTDFYESMHGLLARVAPSHPWLRNAGITAIDYLTIAVPFGDAWVHEEWHRAVLGHNDINSRDDVWNLKNVFAEAISVSHVTDEDLIRLKRDAPRDFVRAKAAGYEAEGELISRLETAQFLSRSRSRAWHVGLYWLVALNDQLYLGAILSPADSAEIDDVTNQANRDEKTVAVRDFSGHDFTAWVYHLFRQDEPFEARGPHPSGAGLSRYIRVADLSSEEKSFLKREGRLAWLNFVDPGFVGITSFSLGGGDGVEQLRANAWLRHALTSFGHTIDMHVLLSRGDLNVHALAQRFTNHDRSFPGMRLEIVDWPMRVGATKIAFSPRLAAWAQPRDQAFRTAAASLGGLAGARVGANPASRFQFYVDAEVKSAGWVAGRPNLGAGTTLLAGFVYRPGANGR